MKITISAQHLLGNDPEGFSASAWDSALEAEYRGIAEDYFPGAEIVVKIDSQNASGSSRSVAIYFDDVDLETLDNSARSGLEFQIEQAANALYDRRGQEFFE